MQKCGLRLGSQVSANQIAPSAITGGGTINGAPCRYESPHACGVRGVATIRQRAKDTGVEDDHEQMNPDRPERRETRHATPTRGEGMTGSFAACPRTGTPALMSPHPKSLSRAIRRAPSPSRYLIMR